MITFQRNFPLSSVSNYKIGGPADYFFEFNSKEELNAALSEWKGLGFSEEKIYVIGDGTNILFRDDGYRGLVLKSNIKFIKHEDDVIEVGAGNKMEELVKYAIQNSLSGLEWAGGLPGTVGGAIRGNAGAFGGETKDSVVAVESFDLLSREIHKRENAKCNFSYRMSIFKKGEGEREVVLGGWFKVAPGNKDDIQQRTKEREEYRENRHPLDMPNIGSTFKNIPIQDVPQEVLEEFKDSIKDDPFPILPIAKLLSVAGLKGKSVGGAMVSPKHPNFIVNTGNAKSSDVSELIRQVKDEIKNKYGVSLEEEIIYL